MKRPQFLQTIHYSEWQWVAIVSICIAVGMALPYVFGWWMTPPGYVYLGLHALSPVDLSLYYSYLEQINDGHLLFKDLFTSEPQRRLFFNPFFFLVGSIRAISDLSPQFVWQLVRTILIVPFGLLLYTFFSFFTGDRIMRRGLFLFTIFASGIGAYGIRLLEPIRFLPELEAQRYWPMDLWVPEFTVFTTLYHNPLFIVSLGLILFVFLTFLLSLEEGREWAYISGISGLLLFLVHPYHFPTVFVVLGAYGAVLAVRLRAFPRIFFQSFLLFTILALPAVLYYVFLFRFDWVMTMRLNQGEALSTVWWSTLFSFGFLLPTALGGIYVLTRRKLWNDRTLFLFTWALVGGILIHTYVLVHPRRLTEGLMIPIAFFSFFGLVTIWSILMARSSKNVRTLFLSNTPLLFFLFLGFFGFTSFFHVVRDLSYFGSQLSVLYWPQEKMNATAWLNKKTAEEAVILASLDNGNIIPGFSGRTVYLGHGAETAFAQAKARDVLWFFGSGASDEARQRWLSREGITHLFISDDERALGDFRPEHVSYLREVFRSGTVSIYAVQREE